MLCLLGYCVWRYQKPKMNRRWRQWRERKKKCLKYLLQMFSLRKLPQNLFNVIVFLRPNLRQPRHRKPSWKIELMILIFFQDFVRHSLPLWNCWVFACCCQRLHWEIVIWLDGFKINFKRWGLKPIRVWIVYLRFCGNPKFPRYFFFFLVCKNLRLFVILYLSFVSFNTYDTHVEVGLWNLFAQIVFKL